MVEFLLQFIILLFTGLVSVTIITIALIIVLVHILGKNTNTHSACRLECVFLYIKLMATTCVAPYFYFYYITYFAFVKYKFYSEVNMLNI